MDMIPFNELSKSAFDFLKPYLPMIAAKAAEKLGEGLPAAVGQLWTAIRAKFAARPAAAEAEKDLLAAPDDSDVQAAFRVQLKKALEEDPEFAALVRKLLGETLAQTGRQATVIGDGVIVQGDRNKVVGAGGVMIEGDVGGDVITGKR